jgi:hypothetical protein
LRSALFTDHTLDDLRPPKELNFIDDEGDLNPFHLREFTMDGLRKAIKESISQAPPGKLFKVVDGKLTKLAIKTDAAVSTLKSGDTLFIEKFSKLSERLFE